MLGRTFNRQRLGALVVPLAIAFVVSACVTVVRDDDAGTPHPATATASASARPPGSSASPGSASARSAAPASEAIPTVPPRSQEPSIGYISLDESVPFVQAVSAGIRRAAEAAGIDLVECDAGWSRDGVSECAGQLAEAGVHGVISFQPFADLAADVCAATAGAPTVGVVFDQGPCQVSRLLIDQAGSGRLAGDAVGSFVADRWDCQVNAYVSLESSDADPDGRARMQGYRDGYSAHCPMPERQLTLDDADRVVTAQTQVAGLLSDLRGKPNIVVGLSEDAIIGAMAAVSEAGRENQFWYSGQLADPSIRQVIACDEHYIASVAQFPEQFGDVLVPTLIDALEGREVPAELSATIELVTSANVRQLFPDTPPCGG